MQNKTCVSVINRLLNPEKTMSFVFYGTAFRRTMQWFASAVLFSPVVSERDWLWWQKLLKWLHATCVNLGLANRPTVKSAKRHPKTWKLYLIWRASYRAVLMIWLVRCSSKNISYISLLHDLNKCIFYLPVLKTVLAL